MSIGTYAELAAAIYAWLLRNSSDLVVTDTQIQNYIFLCEAELNRELKVRELEASTDLVTVAAQNYINLPSDFKKIKDFYFNSSPYDIKPIQTKGELTRKWGTAQGRPVDYNIFGTKIYVGPIPDAVYTMPFDYYAAIVALTATNTTNVILTAFPDLYLYGALRQAYMQIKDDKNGGIVGTNYAGILGRIQDAEMAARLAPNSKMQTRSRLA